jgi:hypothetical protein
LQQRNPTQLHDDGIRVEHRGVDGRQRPVDFREAERPVTFGRNAKDPRLEVEIVFLERSELSSCRQTTRKVDRQGTEVTVLRE